MRTMILAGCLLPAVAAVSAANPEKPPLPVAQQLPVDIVLAQQELAVDVESRGSAVAGMGGLLPALIGMAIDKAAVNKAEARVAGLRNQLIDYRFNESVERTLREKLPSDGLSPDPVFTVCSATAAVVKQTPIGCSASPQAGLLVLVPTYSISGKFDELAVELTAYYIDRGARPNGKPSARRRFAYTYGFFFPTGPVSDDNADYFAAYWAGLGQERLAALLDHGISQIADMLAYDFSVEGRAERETEKRGSASLDGRMFPGQKVREGRGWVWTRMNKRSGDALQGYLPIPRGDPAAIDASLAMARGDAPFEQPSPPPAPDGTPAPPDDGPAPAGSDTHASDRIASGDAAEPPPTMSEVAQAGAPAEVAEVAPTEVSAEVAGVAATKAPAEVADDGAEVPAETPPEEPE